MEKTHYFIRTEQGFENYIDACDAKKKLDQANPLFPPSVISYRVPDKHFKPWVPIWLIRFISKTYKP